MKKPEALAKWSTGCAAIQLKGQWVRNGNWHPLAHLLRHKDCEAAEVTVVEHDGSTILKIEPDAVEPPPGKSAFNRPAFSLIVR